MNWHREEGVYKIPVRGGDAGPTADVERGGETGWAESLEAKVAETEECWKRAAAELENVKKRSARELERARALDRDAVLREWLPVVDSVERALDTGRGGFDPWHEGMKGIHRQMLGVLKTFNVTPFSPEGERFDPHIHEAVSTVSSAELQAGTVAEVLQKGYRIDDRVLRAPKVVTVLD